jgi:hypothetical protein
MEGSGVPVEVGIGVSVGNTRVKAGIGIKVIVALTGTEGATVITSSEFDDGVGVILPWTGGEADGELKLIVGDGPRGVTVMVLVGV